MTALTRLAAILAVVLFSGLASAQGFTGLARMDAAQSRVSIDGDVLDVHLFLSQPVPYRVFTLTDPARLVLDFREVDFRDAAPDVLLAPGAALGLRAGALRPGWSRLVVDLAGPMLLDEAGMRVSETDGTAQVLVRLSPASEADFAAASGAPDDPEWDILGGLAAAALPPADERFVVVIDPGHGGIDPGALRGGMVEAVVVLQFALELAEAIERTGTMNAVLTRDSDLFVPLDPRISIARAAGADLLLSLHADALEVDEARGASVYTLSPEAQGNASARMAERHEQGDLLAGVDLSGHDDTVARVLMDLARLETGPASDRLADALVTGLRDAGAVLNSTPRRHESLAVLTAADFPSALLELGFLSNEGDRSRLSDPEARAVMVAGIVQAIQRWRASEEARAPLVRQ